MYRLPTQFDASASRQALAAAGGGSTSTTCSSCIVTLLGTSVLSAVVLVLFMLDRTELAIVLVMVYASPRVRVLSIISLLVDMTSTLAW